VNSQLLLAPPTCREPRISQAIRPRATSLPMLRTLGPLKQADPPAAAGRGSVTRVAGNPSTDGSQRGGRRSVSGLLQEPSKEARASVFGRILFVCDHPAAAAIFAAFIPGTAARRRLELSEGDGKARQAARICSPICGSGVLQPRVIAKVQLEMVRSLHWRPVDLSLAQTCVMTDPRKMIHARHFDRLQRTFVTWTLASVVGGNCNGAPPHASLYF